MAKPRTGDRKVLPSFTSATQTKPGDSSANILMRRPAKKAEKKEEVSVKPDTTANVLMRKGGKR